MSIKLIQLLTKSLFFASIFTLLYCVLLAGLIVKRDKEYQNKILPNISINNVYFGGKEKKDVIEYYSTINKKLQNIPISITYKDSVATFSGAMIGLRYNHQKIAERAYSIGRGNDWKTIIQERYLTLLGLNSYELAYKPFYTLSPINAHLLALAQKYNTEPKDALFELKNGRVIAFRVDESGTQVSTASAAVELADRVSHISNQKIPTSINIVLTDVELKPKITLAQANNFGILEKIGEGVSNFRGSAPERIHNLTLAATRIHGVLIPPNEIFSYNETVGEISAATGYKTAYVIKNGRTVLGDGGGVCQDSTTLFRAALNTGLPIIERRGHAYRVRYYENDQKPGYDATVFAPTTDFKFKNDTPAHILIQGYVDKVHSTLTFTFYGKNDGRRVELSVPRVYGITAAPPPLYEETPDLPRGVTKQVDWAAAGAKSQFTYKVYDASGNILQDKVFNTTYRAWQAVYLVGTGG